MATFSHTLDLYYITDVRGQPAIILHLHTHNKNAIKFIRWLKLRSLDINQNIIDIKINTCVQFFLPVHKKRAIGQTQCSFEHTVHVSFLYKYCNIWDKETLEYINFTDKIFVPCENHLKLACSCLSIKSSI